MRERRETIMEVSERMFPEVFERSRAETVRWCEKERGRIAEGFLKALGELAGQILSGEEDDVRYLSFSCLHSSIFLKKYLVRMELMGQGLYSDPPLAEAYWDAGDIYGLFERDVEEIKEAARKSTPRIRGYETDYIRYGYAPYYHRMVKAFIREMLEGMLEDVHAPVENGEEQVKILFGEYMGEADILFTVERGVLCEIFQDICR